MTCYVRYIENQKNNHGNWYNRFPIIAKWYFQWFDISSKLAANLKCMIKHEMFSLLSKCYHKFNLYVYFHCKEAGYYMYLHC